MPSRLISAILVTVILTHFSQFRSMSKKKPTDDERWLKAVGMRLREIRREKGYGSYDFFAWENKISPSTYRDMERGGNFTILTLRKVLQKLDVTPEEFFKGVKL